MCIYKCIYLIKTIYKLLFQYAIKIKIINGILYILFLY